MKNDFDPSTFFTCMLLLGGTATPASGVIGLGAALTAGVPGLQALGIALLTAGITFIISLAFSLWVA